MSIQPSRGRGRSPAQSAFFRTIKPRPKEKDPVIDVVTSVIDRTGVEIKELSEKANIARSTYKNLIDGVTMKPQFQTISRTLLAIGYEMQIVPIRREVSGKALKPEGPTIVWAKRDLS